MAWVTHGGDDELEERLAVRPTSEAIIGFMYSKWIKSWRDLPVLINQGKCCPLGESDQTLPPDNRIWQEGHTLTNLMMRLKPKRSVFLICIGNLSKLNWLYLLFRGRKTDREKFAGAVATHGHQL